MIDPGTREALTEMLNALFLNPPDQVKGENMKQLDYQAFIERKLWRLPDSGVKVDPKDIHPSLFDFQRDIALWAMRKGRAAIFADCGLGKTRQQLTWAKFSGKKVLIVCPLSVAQQTIAEGEKIDIEVNFCSYPIDQEGIWITNYEKLKHFINTDFYDAIVLDESSSLKDFGSKTKNLLIQHFTYIPRRLCCTATPSPNDLTELANHAEFLGIMKRGEMLSHFFVHDSDGSANVGGWRLKGHAQNDFWKWVASWAIYLRMPSDLGYENNGFLLPPLTVHEEQVEVGYIPEGELFPRLVDGIRGRSQARRASLMERVQRTICIIKTSWQTYYDCNELAICGKQNMPNGEENDIILANKNEISGVHSLVQENEIKNTCESGMPKTRNKCWQNKEHTDSLTQKKLPLSKDETTENSRANEICKQESGDRIIKRKSETPIFLELTGSPLSNTIPFLNDKEELAQSVNDFPQGYGEMDFTLITATTQIPSGAFSAQVVTSELENSMTIQSDLEQQRIISKEQWIVWCQLNEEQHQVAKFLGKDCVSIEGATPDEEKISREIAWRTGTVPVLVTKPDIFGWGMNWAHCHNVLYVGFTDSFEQYYQSARRVWRFGQKCPVSVTIVTSKAEHAVVENVQRKERQADELARGVIEHMKDFSKEEIKQETYEIGNYETNETEGKGWQLLLGDCVERIKEIRNDAIGLTITSIPFSNLFTYSPSTRDLGNCKDYTEFFAHFDFLIPEWLRVTMPGRRACVHVQQVAMTLVNHGVIGWYDFRGDVIRSFVKHGWIYDSEVVIDKNPQIAAVRTKSKGLLFAQKNKDSSWSHPAMADYILLFRKDGENPEPIKTDVTNEEWIKFAHPIWFNIKESDTLNVAEAREDNDEKHICPLQLEVINRCVRLWSNKNDIILDPFSGLGSTGYLAVQHGRKYLGIELKKSYYLTSVKNLKQAEQQSAGAGLFANIKEEKDGTTSR